MAEKRSIGRPTKLNKTRQNAICDAFSIGCTLEMAAAYANIQVNTVRNWVEEGEKQAARLEMGEQLTDEEMRFVEFLHATDEAKLQAGIRWQQVVDNASNRDPAWAMRMLQYRFPNDYRDNRSVELTGRDGGAIRSEATVTHTFDPAKAKEVLDILTLAGAFDVATEADTESLDGAQSDA